MMFVGYTGLMATLVYVLSPNAHRNCIHEYRAFEFLLVNSLFLKVHISIFINAGFPLTKIIWPIKFVVRIKYYFCWM